MCVVIQKRHIPYIMVIVVMSLIIPTAAVAFMNETLQSRDRRALIGKTIVVDAGHGGVDGGATHGDLLEKHINLNIALRLREELLHHGATVTMTRDEDESLDDHKNNGNRHREDLKKRVQIIQSNEADLFISIHANYIVGKPSRLGPIVFHHDTSERSKELAAVIQQSLNTLHKYKEHNIVIKGTEASGRYYLLRNTSCPGVIVETGFLSNWLDRKLLQDEAHQQDIAVRIAEAVVLYYQSVE